MWGPRVSSFLRSEERGRQTQSGCASCGKFVSLQLFDWGTTHPVHRLLRSLQSLSSLRMSGSAGTGGQSAVNKNPNYNFA
jgi:hypothetical protein